MNNKKIFFIFGAVALIIVIIAVLMRDDDADESTDVDVNVERENDVDDDDDRPVDPMNGDEQEPRDTTPDDDAEPVDTTKVKDTAAKPNTAGSAAARRIVEESVPSGYISSAAMNGDVFQVVLNSKSPDPASVTYFKQGDRLDRLFGIDVPHWFTKLPEANRIKLDVNIPSGTIVFNVTRKQAEDYFGMKLNSALANPDRWRDEFLDEHDNPHSRIRFVNMYVKAPQD